ncbi:hypothetical protein STRIP9103_00168 [Streptomyces ipomoeae 91-03]|uniref:Uncharacterized protein n=1 Tax=Streptomyces ipomoeae 91-03 TaxID=698759 RepID=L1KM88_9ACTN|nr:hypothetical protein STRIP9103_00168 [Streptomyces ipomoeae 91-03]
MPVRAGFGSLGSDLWGSPHSSRADEAGEVLRSRGDRVKGTSHTRHDDHAERHWVAARPRPGTDMPSPSMSGAPCRDHHGMPSRPVSGHGHMRCDPWTHVVTH